MGDRGAFAHQWSSVKHVGGNSIMSLFRFCYSLLVAVELPEEPPGGKRTGSHRVVVWPSDLDLTEKTKIFTPRAPGLG